MPIHHAGVLDGNGLTLCIRTSGVFQKIFVSLSLCLVVLAIGKIARGAILKHESIRYYPKQALPNEFKTRADDLDLAIVVNGAAREGMRKLSQNDPTLTEQTERSVLFPYLEWYKQLGQEEKIFYVSREGPQRDAADKKGLVDMVEQLRRSIAKIEKGDKNEAAILKEPASYPPTDYGTMSWGSIVTLSICDRLDDALFLNTFACWFFVVCITGALDRAGVLTHAESVARRMFPWGVVIGVAIFSIGQTKHALNDSGPLHGWFATEPFRPAIAATQWLDGLLAFATSAVAGWLLVAFVPCCRLAMQKGGSERSLEYRRGLSDAVSAPIRVVRVLVVILVWMFAADFFKFFDQHLKVPEAASTLWVHVAFILLAFYALVRYLPHDLSWSVSWKEIKVGTTAEVFDTPEAR